MAGGGEVFGWILAIASSLLYGVGTLISGSPYLALVRDSAPKARQGLAISTAETVLIIFFAMSWASLLAFGCVNLTRSFFGK